MKATPGFLLHLPLMGHTTLGVEAIFGKGKIYAHNHFTLIERGCQFVSNDQGSALLFGTAHDEETKKPVDPITLLQRFDPLYGLEKITGPFLLFIYYPKRRLLFFKRGRYGGPELFWHEGREGLLLSTSCKPLLRSKLVTISPNLTAISQFASLGSFCFDMTPFAGIYQLEAGRLLEINLLHQMKITNPHPLSSHFRNQQLGMSSSDEIGTHFDQIIQHSLSGYEQFRPFEALPSKHDPLKCMIDAVWETELPMGCYDTPSAVEFLFKAKRERFQVAFMTSIKDFLDTALLPLPKQTHPTTSHSSLLQALHKLVMRWAPSYELHRLRKEQLQDPHIALFDELLFVPPSLVKKITPELGHLFAPDLLLHRFTPDAQFTSPRALRLYMSFKIRALCGTVPYFSRLARHFDVEFAYPLLNNEMVRFIAGLTKEVWNCPELLVWLSKRLPSKPETTVKTACLPIYTLRKFLEKGILVQSGLLRPNWGEIVPQQYIPRTSWMLFLLELWFRLFMEGNCSEEQPRRVLDQMRAHLLMLKR